MKEIILKTNNLTKKYKDFVALDKINIEINKGDIYGLIGRNGAGKTTLMKIITTLANKTSGEFTLLNHNDNDLTETKRRIGSLIENPAFFPNLSAYDNLKYYAIQKGITNYKQIDESLKLVGVDDVKKKKFKNFSLGMKQRLGIAQAVLNDPKILVLDEPTAGLDPKERIRFRNLISSFSKDKIVILSTHIVSDIEYIADTILMMKGGKIIINSPSEGVTKEIDKKVWRCRVPQNKVDIVSSKYRVVNLQHEGNNEVSLRIVSDTKPDENAINVDPTLEDLFLYHFDDMVSL